MLPSGFREQPHNRRHDDVRDHHPPESALIRLASGDVQGRPRTAEPGRRRRTRTAGGSRPERRGSGARIGTAATAATARAGRFAERQPLASAPRAVMPARNTAATGLDSAHAAAATIAAGCAGPGQRSAATWPPRRRCPATRGEHRHRSGDEHELAQRARAPEWSRTGGRTGTPRCRGQGADELRPEQRGERREQHAVGERVMTLVPAPVPDREPLALEQLHRNACAARSRTCGPRSAGPSRARSRALRPAASRVRANLCLGSGSGRRRARARGPSGPGVGSQGQGLNGKRGLAPH